MPSRNVYVCVCVCMFPHELRWCAAWYTLLQRKLFTYYVNEHFTRKYSICLCVLCIGSRFDAFARFWYKFSNCYHFIFSFGFVFSFIYCLHSMAIALIAQKVTPPLVPFSLWQCNRPGAASCSAYVCSCGGGICVMHFGCIGNAFVDCTRGGWGCGQECPCLASGEQQQQHEWIICEEQMLASFHIWAVSECLCAWKRKKHTQRQWTITLEHTYIHLSSTYVHYYAHTI